MLIKSECIHAQGIPNVTSAKLQGVVSGNFFLFFFIDKFVLFLGEEEILPHGFLITLIRIFPNCNEIKAKFCKKKNANKNNTVSNFFIFRNYLLLF